MTLAKRCLPWTVALCCCLGWLAWAGPPGAAQSFSTAEGGHRYGPTLPGGYYVQVTPRSVVMSQPQRPQVTVTVTDAVGRPVDDILATFTPSEGEVTVGQSRTRGGAVIGIFSAAAGSDSPRTASLVITVENVAVTVFIDIVPAVFGR